MKASAAKDASRGRAFHGLYRQRLAACWRAIEARDPALLMDMLQMTTDLAQPAVITAGRHRAPRSSSMLVQVNGRYAIALVLDGVVLCLVPVGTQATLVGESA